MNINRKLTIGIICYPTFGGSGVIATESGMELAKRGHRVHFISYDVPRRLNRFLENVFYHEVEPASYPLFQEPHYVLALASKIVQIAEQERLDIVHVHYAIPHAVSAYLAKQMLGAKAPKIVTTLHGTDITLVGSDPGYLGITRFAVEHSDAITAVSQFLKDATYKQLGISSRLAIEVIPNFVDLEVFGGCRERAGQIRKMICREFPEPQPYVITHVSNFRPVKRIDLLINAFALVRKEAAASLVLVGDGPERSKAEKLCAELGVEADVCFLGKQDSVSEVLCGSDVFALSSDTESFGLGLLEAMASGVPVVAPRVGGIPEVFEDGKHGLLVEPASPQALAKALLELYSDPHRRQRMGEEAREYVVRNYDSRNVVGLYEQLYMRL